MPAVYATKNMVYLMELAASKAVHSALPDGWFTLGIKANVRHLSPTPIGRTVTTKARVTGVTDTRIDFEVSSHDDVRRIGDGTHSPSAIELELCNEKLANDQY